MPWIYEYVLKSQRNNWTFIDVIALQHTTIWFQKIKFTFWMYPPHIVFFLNHITILFYDLFVIFLFWYVFNIKVWIGQIEFHCLFYILLNKGYPNYPESFALVLYVLTFEVLFCNWSRRMMTTFYYIHNCTSNFQTIQHSNANESSRSYIPPTLDHCYSKAIHIFWNMLEHPLEIYKLLWLCILMSTLLPLITFWYPLQTPKS